VWVRVLGPSRVSLGEDPSAAVDLGARKPRSVLAALALRLGTDVSPDALADLVWGEDPPRGAHGTLHSYLSGVRRVLEPGLGPRQKPTVLLTSDHGYRLDLRREQVDAHRFADEVRARRRVLAPLASQFTTGPAADWPDRTTISEHVDALEDLLGLWTGDAYADLPDHPEVALERNALDQLRRGAEEDRVLGLLALGDHAVVVAATEQATARHVLEERVWALHALALARSGRQAESLAVLRHIRRVLADELGLDPGQELRDLEQAVLAQDPVLQQWLRPEVTLATPPTAGPAPATRPATPPPPPATPSSPPDTGRRAVGWGTVGREQEVAALEGVLDRAAAGEAAYALLVGEPGIGKSRLVERVAQTATERGFVVATGRCAQDDGAPPLWPWSQALGDLGRHDGRPLDAEVERLLSGYAESEDPLESAERQAFRTWESIAREVLTRAGSTPVLLVLEDLHWADTASLRVLRRLLASTAPGQQLAVVATRRPWPEPTGALADVGDELARRHVVRLDLEGLSESQAAALVEDVTGGAPDPDVVAEWHARSEGNPFFLIELARLGADGPVDAVPATVRDVVARRYDALPEQTRSLLLLAAVLGRRSSLDVLAAIAEQPIDEVEDLLQPAREAGLVLEPEAGTLAFTHALTRDAVAATTTASRIARLHARVAHSLADGGSVARLVGPEERVAELARHWLAAGPSYAGHAWRAATAAAAQARRTFSWVEAEQLMAAAIEAHRRDPTGTAAERIDLLLTRAHDSRPNAEWNQVLLCAAEAISLARREEDLERLVAAAAAASDNLVWTPMQWNEVLEDTIEDLRWALAQTPPSDSVDRCRLMLALAMQLYYDPSARAELEALADEGHAMAHRIGDPALLWWASQTAWKALWTPKHGEARLALAHQGLDAARAAHDPDSEAVALVILAGSALEMGDRATFEQAARETERLARRRRNSYVRLALAWVQLSLASLRRDPETMGQLMAELYELRPRLNPSMEMLHLAGIQLMSTLWTPEIGQLIEPLTAATDYADDDLARDVLIQALARTGDVARVREELSRPIEHQVDNWSSSSTWCCLAEAAAVAGDTVVAATMLERLEPLAGRIGVSGISTVWGPVDGYLALVLSVCGRQAEATAAADRAEAQAQEWQFPAFTDWLSQWRERLEI
jgi:DNA-binding SARP family transcriptional activator/DNA replicative helicase MCM subunit Mcm2 (Cdc46/Mcm family)